MHGRDCYSKEGVVYALSSRTKAVNVAAASWELMSLWSRAVALPPYSDPWMGNLALPDDI